MILKRQLAVEVFPRGRTLPKEEPVNDPEESGNKRVPKKKRKFSFKEQEQQLQEKAPKSYSRKIINRMDISLVRNNLQTPIHSKCLLAIHLKYSSGYTFVPNSLTNSSSSPFPCPNHKFILCKTFFFFLHFNTSETKMHLKIDGMPYFNWQHFFLFFGI